MSGASTGRTGVAREPVLTSVAIAELRPTQMTVGYREVREKQREWQAIGDAEKQARFVGSHLIPVVLGPKDRSYVVDHHHLARALLEAGVKKVATTVIGDLSHLDKDEFWTVMQHRSWVYPFDATGKRRPIADLPKAIAELADDPYRSLAGALRRIGGFAKDTAPFSEFLWADFLRRRIKHDQVEENFSKALEAALELAKSKPANYLPGWCGPVA